MTWSAPSERTKSSLSPLATPVTSAPIAFAICTRNGPTLPDAPSTSTLSPGWIVLPLRRRSPCKARTAECGRVAAILESSARRGSGGTPSPGAQAILRERALHRTEHVGEDAVTGLEAAHRRPDRLDDASASRPIVLDPRRAKAHEQPNELPSFGRSPSRSPRLTDATCTRIEHLIVLRCGPLDLAQLTCSGRRTDRARCSHDRIGSRATPMRKPVGSSCGVGLARVCDTPRLAASGSRLRVQRPSVARGGGHREADHPSGGALRRRARSLPPAATPAAPPRHRAAAPARRRPRQPPLRTRRP